MCGVRSVRKRRKEGVWCMERRGEICALRRAEGRGRELCHAAGDMRAYGAREGIAGMYGAGDSGEI